MAARPVSSWLRELGQGPVGANDELGGADGQPFDVVGGCGRRPGTHPEIGDQGPVVVVEEHIVEGYAAVDDPQLMCARQGEGELVHDLAHTVDRCRAPGHQGVEAAPGDQFLDEDGPVGLPPKVEDRHHLWRIELGNRLGLCLEPPDEGWVVGYLCPDHLDRDLSADSGLIGAVDVPVPGFAKARPQLVSTHRQARISPALTSTTRHRLQPGVTGENLFFQVAQVGRGFDTEL